MSCLPPEPNSPSLEPEGGNVYRPHKLMVTSGQFWRCAHGLTGFNKDLDWLGCADCRADDPAAYAKFHEATPMHVEAADLINALDQVLSPTGDVEAAGAVLREKIEAVAASQRAACGGEHSSN